MRWTDENKNILWRTIFETQNLTIDLEKLSAGWPGEEKPSAKALKEQLDKYRKNLKGDNVVTFSMKRKSGAESSPASTPRKRRNTPKKKPAKKVKSDTDEEDQELDEEYERAMKSEDDE